MTVRRLPWHCTGAPPCLPAWWAGDFCECHVYGKHLAVLADIIGAMNDQFARAVAVAAFVVGRLVVTQDARLELATENLREAKYRRRLVDAKWDRRHGRTVAPRPRPRRDPVAVGADSVSSGRELRPRQVPWMNDF